jgi:hypothetical protein
MQSSINDDINASAAPSFGRHKSLIEIHNTTPKFFEESSKKTRFDYDTDDSSISRRQSSSSALDVGPPPPLVSNNSWEMPPQNPTLAKDDSLGFGFSFISVSSHFCPSFKIFQANLYVLLPLHYRKKMLRVVVMVMYIICLPNNFQLMANKWEWLHLIAI